MLAVNGSRRKRCRGEQVREHAIPRALLTGDHAATQLLIERGANREARHDFGVSGRLSLTPGTPSRSLAAMTAASGGRPSSISTL
jgi:hypothetical protein